MTLLDQDIDRKNFKKKIMTPGILEQQNQTLQCGAGRPARLFRFNRKKYFEIKDKGYNFDIFIKSIFIRSLIKFPLQGY